MTDEHTRLIEDVFSVDCVVSTAHDGPQVRLGIDTPEHSVDMTMSPEAALWLSRELWQASGLPMDHSLRIRRRRAS